MGKRRAKGTGSLLLRNGVWYAKWQHGGIAKMQSTGIREGDDADGMTARERAEEWLLDRTEPLRMRHREDGIALLVRQMQTEEERLADRIARARGRLLLGGMPAAFKESPRRPDCGAEMLDFYCGVLRRLAEAVGPDVAVADFGDAEAEDYARKIGARMAAGTFNKAINALSLAWRVLGREAGLSHGTNPWEGIAKKRADTHVRRPFTRKETDAILEAAKGEMKTLVAVCLYTGLRLGDACLFKWEDVRGKAAYVITAKRDRKVAIPIHPKLDQALGERRESGYVMPKMAARYRMKQGSSNVSRSVKRLVERCGIESSVKAKNGRKRPDATAHSFRHAFVTRAIEAGVPPHVVQQIVGHASATMTERYTHLSDKAVLKAFGKMG